MSLWAPHTEGPMTISHQGPFWSCPVDPAWPFSLSLPTKDTSSKKLPVPLGKPSWPLD